MPSEVVRAFVVLLVMAIAVVTLEGCSLFTNLDVDGYTAADTGKAEASLCLGNSCVIECTSSADCQPGDVCCATLTSLTSYRLTCCAGGQLRMPDGGDGGDE